MDRQIDKKLTKQILIGASLHRYIKMLASSKQEPLKSIVERALVEYYDLPLLINSLSKEGIDVD